MKILAATFAALTLLSLGSCSRDPNAVKVRYLENGNKYFARGRYKEASIMYRNALKKDALFGPAYYRLGLTELKLGRIPQAVAALRRALESKQFDRNGQDYRDAAVKLADTYLAVSRAKEHLDETEKIAKELLEKDPASYDGHRLLGDLAFVGAQQAHAAQNNARSTELIQTAIAEYRKADATRPSQTGVQLALARSLWAARDFAGAEALYRAVMTREKATALAYTELYNLYLTQNKLGDAEQTLKLAISNNPKNPGFVTLLAAHYFRFKRRDDGVQVLKTMTANLRDFPRAYLNAGDFYGRLNDWAQAAKEYREGLARDESHKVEYQRSLIEALMRQGKRAEAAELNAAILKDNPKDNEARGFAASLLLDKGEIARAVTELQGVVGSDPKNIVARFDLGRAHMARGELEQARQQFTEAIKLRPDYVAAHLALAQLHIMRGEYDAAIQVAQDVRKLDPNNTNARLVESAALMAEKRFGDSRQLLDTVIKAEPSSPEAFIHLGVANLQDRKYKEAEDSFRKAYQLSPANIRGLMGVVETYMAQNRSADALQVLQEEARKAPDRVEVRIALGNIAVRTGRYDAAVTEYEAALQKLDPKSREAGDIYLRLGETARRKGDLRGAVDALQKARGLAPDSPVVTGALALSLETAGRKDEARAAYEQTLKLQPNNGVALNNLAYLMAENGRDLDQALTLAQKAKQLLPKMPEVSDTLGWIYLKKSLNDNAVQIFTDLVSKEPGRATYRYHLGMALSQKGDKARALKELQQALGNNPTKDEAAKIRELISKLG